MILYFGIKSSNVKMSGMVKWSIMIDMYAKDISYCI